MTIIVRLCAVALLVASQSALSASAVRELATVTGTNVGFVSSQLARYQKTVNEIAGKRIERMALTERLAAQARLQADREVAVLNATGGGDIVKVFNAVREQADKSAAAPGVLDAVQAQAHKDASAAYTPLAFQTGKLDDSAKALARLGKSRSFAEQVAFVTDYAKEAREEVEKLKNEAESKKSSADGASETKAASDTVKQAPAPKS